MGGELLLQDEEEELSQCFAISWDVHQVRVMYLIHFKVRRFNVEKSRTKERFRIQLRLRRRLHVKDTTDVRD